MPAIHYARRCMRIALSTDLKTPLIDTLCSEIERYGHDVKYVGPEADGAEADWPDVTSQAMRLIQTGKSDEAIVCCWTGTGACIAANKHRGIRAALCTDAETARGARVWNVANVLALSLRLTTDALAKEILGAWFTATPGDDEWNRSQVAKISDLEQEC
ncbi:MAG: RpiB/LacA/LacB family sugar-phosphate isomerase [Rhodothermales bacterium]